MRQPSANARLPDWPERLAAFIEARRCTPFAWGAQDCCLFAADAALAATGSDPMAEIRGTYSTEDEADALLREDGLAALVASTLAAWGAHECAPGMAQRGDIVMVNVGNQQVCGVSLGATVAIPATERLAFLPCRTIARAWAI